MHTISSFQVDKASFESFPNQPQGHHRATDQMANCWTSARFHWQKASEAHKAGNHTLADQQLALAHRYLNRYRQGLRSGGKTTRKKPLGRDLFDHDCGDKSCKLCISNRPGGKASARRKAQVADTKEAIREFVEEEEADEQEVVVG